MLRTAARGIWLISSDFIRMSVVCGPIIATRWLWAIATNLRAVGRAGNLQPADLALGPGPFRCRLRSARAKLSGKQVLSGIREIWCRDVYLGDELRILDGDVVVDLGANMGNFTLLALAHGPKVRVVAVEPDAERVEMLRAQLEINGWSDRCKVLNAFGGQPNRMLSRLQAEGRELGAHVSDQEILQAAGGGPIDLIKCDIEGSEYSLLGPDSLLLRATRQIAFELHYLEGDAAEFKRGLARAGFRTSRSREGTEAGVYRAFRAAFHPSSGV